MNTNLSTEEALKLVNSHHWKHSFELVPGIVTPGDWSLTDSAKLLDTIYQVPKNLSGLRALDIGALDGVHSFELERRGATVTALDIQSPDVTGFNIAKRIIDSKVEYVQGNVYELTALIKEKYDIILFFGVWYHLKNPVRAFEEVASALKDAGILYAEGESLKDYVEIAETDASQNKHIWKQIADSEVALSIYYPFKYKGDLWTWNVPNKACVEAWLQTCGMEILSSYWWHDSPHQRLHVVARKNLGIATTVDNPVW